MGSWCFTAVTGRQAALEKDNANMRPHKHDVRWERSTSKHVFPYFFCKSTLYVKLFCRSLFCAKPKPHDDSFIFFKRGARPQEGLSFVFFFSQCKDMDATNQLQFHQTFQLDAR